MVESDGLLNRCTGYTVPGVRIPPSPPISNKPLINKGFQRFLDLIWEMNGGGLGTFFIYRGRDAGLTLPLPISLLGWH